MIGISGISTNDSGILPDESVVQLSNTELPAILRLCINSIATPLIGCFVFLSRTSIVSHSPGARAIHQVFSFLLYPTLHDHVHP